MYNISGINLHFNCVSSPEKKENLHEESQVCCVNVNVLRVLFHLSSCHHVPAAVLVVWRPVDWMKFFFQSPTEYYNSDKTYIGIIFKVALVCLFALTLKRHQCIQSQNFIMAYISLSERKAPILGDHQILEVNTFYCLTFRLVSVRPKTERTAWRQRTRNCKISKF